MMKKRTLNIALALICTLVFVIGSSNYAVAVWPNNTFNASRTITIVPDQTTVNESWLIQFNSSLIDFDEFFSPRGEEFRIYNEDNTTILNHWTENSNISSSYLNIMLWLQLPETTKAVPLTVNLFYQNLSPVETFSNCSLTHGSCIDFTKISEWAGAGGQDVTAVDSSQTSNESFLNFSDDGQDGILTRRFETIAQLDYTNITNPEIIFRFRMNTWTDTQDFATMNFNEKIAIGLRATARLHILGAATTASMSDCTVSSAENGTLSICWSNTAGGATSGAMVFNGTGPVEPSNFTKDVWWRGHIRLNVSSRPSDWNGPEAFSALGTFSFWNQDYSFNRTVTNGTHKIFENMTVTNLSISPSSPSSAMLLHLQYAIIKNMTSANITIHERQGKPDMVIPNLTNIQVIPSCVERDQVLNVTWFQNDTSGFSDSRCEFNNPANVNSTVLAVAEIGNASCSFTVDATGTWKTFINITDDFFNRNETIITFEVNAAGVCGGPVGGTGGGGGGGGAAIVTVIQQFFNQTLNATAIQIAISESGLDRLLLTPLIGPFSLIYFIVILPSSLFIIRSRKNLKGRHFLGIAIILIFSLQQGGFILL